MSDYFGKAASIPQGTVFTRQGKAFYFGWMETVYSISCWLSPTREWELIRDLDKRYKF